MLVLDANILIRAVLGRRVRHLLDTYTAHGVGFYAPDVAFVDAQKYLPPLLVKRGKPVADVSAAIDFLNTSLNQSIRNSMSFLKPKPGSACAVVTRMIGPC